MTVNLLVRGAIFAFKLCLNIGCSIFVRIGTCRQRGNEKGQARGGKRENLSNKWLVPRTGTRIHTDSPPFSLEKPSPLHSKESLPVLGGPGAPFPDFTPPFTGWVHLKRRRDVLESDEELRPPHSSWIMTAVEDHNSPRDLALSRGHHST